MRTIALVQDMFFRARITATAETMNSKVDFASSPYQIKEADLIIVDLQKFGSESIVQLRQSNPTARIVGYLPHIDMDLKASAQQAGFSQV